MTEERFESEEELDEYIDQKYHDGFNAGFVSGGTQMLIRIQKTLEIWPRGGFDIEIKKSIDRICEEYYKQKKDEEWQRQFSEKVMC